MVLSIVVHDGKSSRIRGSLWCLHASTNLSGHNSAAKFSLGNFEIISPKSEPENIT